MNEAKNVFGGAAVMLGGLDQFYAETDEQDVMLDMDEIHVKEQVRTEFEDGEHSIQQMADSLNSSVGQIQPILVRPLSQGGYELVTGERRYRAAKLLHWKQIKATIRNLTNEEAEDVQYAENVQRKNLTQAEEARKLARDLERLGGDRAALCIKHSLTKSYVSKILAVLDLQTQGRRLLDENVTSDLETINKVRRLEKIAGSNAAKDVVDGLVSKRGGDKREFVDEALARHGVKKDKMRQDGGKNKPKAAKQQELDVSTDSAITLPSIEDPDAMDDNEFLDAVTALLRQSNAETVCEATVAKRADKLLRELFKGAMNATLKNVAEHGLSCFRGHLLDVTGGDVLRFAAFMQGTKAKGDSDFSLLVTLRIAERELANW